MAAPIIVRAPAESHTVTVTGPEESPTVTVAPNESPTVYITAEIGLVGPKGDPGESAVNAPEVHEFTAERIWTISHNLSARPSVEVTDAGGNKVIPEIHYSNDTTVFVIHARPFTGSALLRT